jgi:hypothetical protein
MPASTSARIVAGSALAGPSVQEIFARRRVRGSASGEVPAA